MTSILSLAFSVLIGLLFLLAFVVDNTSEKMAVNIVYVVFTVSIICCFTVELVNTHNFMRYLPVNILAISVLYSTVNRLKYQLPPFIRKQNENFKELAQIFKKRGKDDDFND